MKDPSTNKYFILTAIRNSPGAKCSIIKSISFMYLSGAEKPTFRKADSSYVKAKFLRPETVLPAVLTLPQPWLINLSR